MKCIHALALLIVTVLLLLALGLIGGYDNGQTSLLGFIAYEVSAMALIFVFGLIAGVSSQRAVRRRRFNAYKRTQKRDELKAERRAIARRQRSTVRPFCDDYSPPTEPEDQDLQEVTRMVTWGASRKAQSV